jgi:hypothetical protein
VPRPKPILGWRFFAIASLLTMNLLILIAGCVEIHSYWWLRSVAHGGDQVHDDTMKAHLSYSALLMTFGGVLLGFGFSRSVSGIDSFA